MRKPMLKMVLLIAFVLFTALSCEIFISTNNTSDYIRDRWLLIYYDHKAYASANVVCDISRSTIIETQFGVYQGATTYTISGDIIALASPAAVGLTYLPNPPVNTFTVDISGDEMTWDVGNDRNYFVFQKY